MFAVMKERRVFDVMDEDRVIDVIEELLGLCCGVACRLGLY